jgi:hypothetical protein
MAPTLISMNRRQFFQQSAAAAICAEGMLPSSLEAQSPEALLPGGAEAAAVAAINPPAGVRVAGMLMIPVVGGKYKVGTTRSLWRSCRHLADHKAVFLKMKNEQRASLLIVNARLTQQNGFLPMHETSGSASLGLVEGTYVPLFNGSDREMRAYMTKMGIDT